MRATEAYQLLQGADELRGVPQLWGARHLLGQSSGPRVVWVPGPREAIEPPTSSRHQPGVHGGALRSRAAVALRQAAAELHLQVPSTGGPEGWAALELLLERVMRALHGALGSWGNLQIGEGRPAGSEEVADSMEGYVLAVSCLHPIYKENPTTVPLTVAVNVMRSP